MVAKNFWFMLHTVSRNTLLFSYAHHDIHHSLLPRTNTQFRSCYHKFLFFSQIHSKLYDFLFWWVPLHGILINLTRTAKVYWNDAIKSRSYYTQTWFLTIQKIWGDTYFKIFTFNLKVEYLSQLKGIHYKVYFDFVSWFYWSYRIK